MTGFSKAKKDLHASLPRRTSRWRRPPRGLVIIPAIAVAVTLTGGEAVQAVPGASPEIVVLSNRADLVSGGDALVEVKLPEGVDPRVARVALDGRDITHEFAVRPNGRYQGLVTGLREGINELTAHVSRHVGAKLTVTNYSKQGPIFAGRKVQPWICGTEDFGLGPAIGRNCVAPARYDYLYKSEITSEFETYNPASPPADALIAETTTDEGKTVPYIVRRERGVINRGIYEIAVLVEPGLDWRPWAPQPVWNGKLHWLFDGGCSPRHQQRNIAGPNGSSWTLTDARLGDLPLSRGFAVATSTLNFLNSNCNEVVSAETTMMIKEHFIEKYGPVRYTISSGWSGGSMQQHVIANNYPGLIDGIIPIWSALDIWTIAVGDSTDCGLLDRHFNETSPLLWGNPLDRAAVTGGVGDAPCANWYGLDKPDVSLGGNNTWLDPTMGCTVVLTSEPEKATEGEPAWVYDPQANPDGVRCAIQDYQAAIFGHRPTDGFANRPYDNVGIQYGLTALLRGQITPEQFVDLNLKIGGRDIDYNWTPERSKADTDGLRNLYRSGLIVDGRNLDRVPMMDVRTNELTGVHSSVHTQMMRARLIAANGHADNQVRWIQPGQQPTSKEAGEMLSQAFITLDQWLSAIESDGSDSALERKVLSNKPAKAKDACWVAGQPELCGDSLPNESRPRIVADGPLASDIFKCQMKPIDWDDYDSVEFTDEQKRNLEAAFPDGVCDWTQPGVEEQSPAGVWQSFASAAGGRPLGPEPRSVPVKGKS